MKKLTLVLSVFAVIALSSCSKEKDCECTTTVTGSTTKTVSQVHIEEGECSDNNITQTVGTIEQKMECVEK